MIVIGGEGIAKAKKTLAMRKSKSTSRRSEVEQRVQSHCQEREGLEDVIP